MSRELRRGLWFASNENGSYRPYRPKRLKTGPWTSGPFYSALAAQRKADLRRREIPQAAPHGLGPVARLGAGRAAQGVEPGTDRGTVEGRVRRRPVDADQPRVPLPVDLRQAAAGAGPAPVSGARQETPDEEKGQGRRKGRASRCACPSRTGPRRSVSRKGFGHFESDTVVGAAPSRRCINTQVERRSRRLFARLVDDKSASATARAEYEIFKGMPPAARVDRTWDNGTEASLHVLVDEALGMLT